MVCFDLFGLRLALDFTAPAWFALLSLYLPPAALCRTAAACLLHECAHLLVLALTGRKPALLRVSATGLRLETTGTAVMPLRIFAAILLAGPLSNLLTAVLFSASGMRESASVHLSLCGFNLLPFRSTDGGTLLYAWLEQHYASRAPELPRRIMRMLGCITAVVVCVCTFYSKCCNLSLLGMALMMLTAEFADQPHFLQNY